jgi:hypothetical protein
MDNGDGTGLVRQAVVEAVALFQMEYPGVEIEQAFVTLVGRDELGRIVSHTHRTAA